jgi:pimeloyl-ACP methyl ester carboxylesterase
MDLPAEWTAETARANGIDLQTYRTGEGPPVVMAHGFYDDGRCWIPLAEDLAEEYEVITYDARGHGTSDAPETGYAVEDRVADLAGVVEAFDLVDPILVGHSMGAATVAWTAAKRPELPRAVVLEDPIGLTGTPDMDPERRVQATLQRLEEREQRTVEEEIEENYEEFDPEWARRSAVADTEVDENAAEIAREGYPAPLMEAFADIECPTLVLKSDGDLERRVSDLEAAAELDSGRMVHVPDAGHYVFQTQYEAAVAELRAFLERV